MSSVSRDRPSAFEVVAALILSSSAYVFSSLVIGNYLVFSPIPSVQTAGSYFLTPVYFISVAVLGLAPFDEGSWAFGGFLVFLISVTALRVRKCGLRAATSDTFTVLAPSILVCFEVGVYFLIPSFFYAQVTNFVGRIGLGNILTNFSVLVVSILVLVAGLLSKFSWTQRIIDRFWRPTQRG